MAISKKNTPNADNDTVVLLLQVPRTNEKKELAAEQMFAALHGLLTFPPEKFYLLPKRVRISFEIAVVNKRIGFYICVPRYLKDFAEEQLYAQYPTVQISEVTDYSAPREDEVEEQILSTELKFIANPALPIKTFQSFEVDPLAAITATLAKFEDNEEAWIQLVVRPATDNWQKKSEKYIQNFRGSSGTSTSGIMGALWAPPETTKGDTAKLTEYESARARAAEEKSHKLAFETTLRIVYRGGVSKYEASLRLQSIIASYKQFNTTYLNGFDQTKIVSNNDIIGRYQARFLSSKPLMLNIEEVATLYHLPHTNVETPYILWASSQTAEPPANLPIVNERNYREVSPMAVANFRGKNIAFGLPRTDRGRHLYILGQTGVGKSGMLELLTMADIASGDGFAVIDPHGDYAMNILQRIPAERAHDVIYFNPADTEYPIAFNPMEVLDPKLRTHTVSELIGVLKRMFESWGPRLEYILRYTLLALLEYPNSTMLDITRMLTEKKFRKEVLTYVTDPVVRTFWEVEFTSWNDKFAAEAVAPVLNKVGAFTANPLVRNIIGQPKSSFNIREIMDQRKILIVNLSRGLVGEDNAALLGSLFVTKMQLAAMSRADVPADQRAPFYLYVDEFQNFATDSFATILSEARKYALNLTVANQYIAQMSQEVRDAVFGNVGSVVSFRMGADDARNMLRYFVPKFEEYDLIHMHNRHFVISMTIDGEKTQAFSAITLNLPEPGTDMTAEIVANSRRNHALTRPEVENYVRERYHLEASVVGNSAPKEPKPHTPKKAPEPQPEPVFNPEVDPALRAPAPKKKTPGLTSVGHAIMQIASDTLPKPKVENDEKEDKPKRKRKRTRRKKSQSEKPQETTADSGPVEKTPAKKPEVEKSKPPKGDSGTLDGDEGEIIFRR